MSKFIGREAVLSWGGAPVAGVRTKSIQIGNELVDFTDDNSDGSPEFAPVAGRKDVTFSVSGVLDDFVLEDASFSQDISGALNFVYPSGRTISCDARINSFSVTGEHEGEATFDAEFTASGAVAVTAGAG